MHIFFFQTPLCPATDTLTRYTRKIYSFVRDTTFGDLKKEPVYPVSFVLLIFFCILFIGCFFMIIHNTKKYIIDDEHHTLLYA